MINNNNNVIAQHLELTSVFSTTSKHVPVANNNAVKTQPEKTVGILPMTHIYADVYYKALFFRVPTSQECSAVVIAGSSCPV